MQTQPEQSEQLRSVAADTRGKHRVSAELKRLEQETRFLELPILETLVEGSFCHILGKCEAVIILFSPMQEELEQLEKMEAASAACKEILSSVETRPDPLLPTTNGPTNPLWDRWFEGPQDKSGCRCWIL